MIIIIIRSLPDLRKAGSLLQLAPNQSNMLRTDCKVLPRPSAILKPSAPSTGDPRPANDFNEMSGVSSLDPCTTLS